MKLTRVTRDPPFDVYCRGKFCIKSEHKSCSSTKLAAMRCAALKAGILAVYIF